MSEINFIKKYESEPEEQKILLLFLRSYAIAVQKKINLPSITYLDEIGGMLEISRSRAKSIADEYIKKFFKVPAFNLNQSMSLYLGMFNATLDTGELVNLNDIRQTVKTIGFVQKSVAGITIKPVKFEMGYGKFKKIYTYTQEYGSKNINNSKTPTYVQFLLKIKKGDKIQGASFNIYHTGRVRFSGGYLEGDKEEAKALVRFISENYFPINLRLPITINNNTIEIKLGSSVRVLGIYTLLDVARRQAKFNGYTLTSTFEPEKHKFITKQRKNSPFLYISFKKSPEDKFGLVVSRSGTVIVEGVSDVAQTWLVVRKFFDALKESGLLENPPARKKNLTITHKPSKLARRLNMKPAPEITRRGTSCPKKRRPDPYSFQGKCLGKNYYTRPNPQGQPCCYKKPKSIQYIRNRLENRYNRANVRVPNAVRRTFGFGGNTNRKANNVGRSSLDNLVITFDKKVGKNKRNPVGLKIGSRQCSRYSKVALVDIAHRKGIELPKKVTKPILCEILAKFAQSPRPRRRSPTPPSPPRARSASRSASANNSNMNNIMNFARQLRAR